MKYGNEGVTAVLVKIPLLTLVSLLVFLLLAVVIIIILKNKTKLSMDARISISIVVSALVTGSLFSTFLEVTRWI